MLRKLLIANRGEIAARIARTARGMGIAMVGVYSDADADGAWLALVDESVRVGGAAPRDSYLSVEAVISAATRTGVDAIHPGYGFLSENAAFAEACIAAGMAFVGPPPAAIRAMADKAAARRLMRDAGVPVAPGCDAADAGDATLAREAERIGFPVMVKAAAGGGGRGMRRVESAAELHAALASARAEAEAAFGDGKLFIEKLVERARHIEVQVFADVHGNVVHLGERDCSVQRRHQKLVEETPAPHLPEGVRTRLCRAAVDAARAVGYVGAGTVEFLWDGGEAMFFMEMNTRLQVEHPVTELVTGLDLVEWQLRVAAGDLLPLRQDEIRFGGHAIEARLCAEDPTRDFAPASGRVLAWAPSERLRVDHALAAPGTVPAEYDCMLAKLVAWGETREVARLQLVRGLRETVLLGMPTNRAFLASVLEHPRFVAGEADTGFVAEEARVPSTSSTPPGQTLALAAALLFEIGDRFRGREEWRNWRSTGPAPTSMRLAVDDRLVPLTVEPAAAHDYAVEIARERFAVRLPTVIVGTIDATIDAVRQRVAVAMDADTLYLGTAAGDCVARDATHDRARATQATSDGAVRAPLTGRVVQVMVEAGAQVTRGQLLVVMEAMKMEHRILAPGDGRVVELRASIGMQASAGVMLLQVQAATPVAATSLGP
jgi:geranyl-CoA carboxylase alpha subunit